MRHSEMGGSLGIAYLAGLVSADGHLEKTEPYVYIAGKNDKFIKTVVTPLLQEVTNRKPSVYWDRSAKVYKARTYNRKLWYSLMTEYGIPSGKKAYLISSPRKINDAAVILYIRGWFDGEGWPEEMKVRKPSGTYRYPRIGFKAKSQSIRDWIAMKLNEIGVRAKPYDRRDGSFGLWINGRRACMAFNNKIGFLNHKNARRLDRLLKRCTGRIGPYSHGLR